MPVVCLSHTLISLPLQRQRNCSTCGRSAGLMTGIPGRVCNCSTLWNCSSQGKNELCAPYMPKRHMDCSLIGKNGKHITAKGGEKQSLSFVYTPSNWSLYIVLSSNSLQFLVFFSLDLFPPFFHSPISFLWLSFLAELIITTVVCLLTYAYLLKVFCD